MGFKSVEYGRRNKRVAQFVQLSLWLHRVMKHGIIYHHDMMSSKKRTETQFEPGINDQRITPPFPQLGGKQAPLELGS